MPGTQGTKTQPAQIVVQRRCWGITRSGLNLSRCGRRGDWHLYCSQHFRQPFTIALFLFAFLAEVASIQSAGWFSPVLVLIAKWKRVPAPPPPYVMERWNWDGDRGSWHRPGHWEDLSHHGRPAMRINGPPWELGWPMQFDKEVLHDFVLRFRMYLPGAQSAGTIVVWMLRAHPGERPNVLGNSVRDVNTVPGYQFALMWHEDHLLIRGSIVRQGGSTPILLDKPLFTGLHYHGKPTAYSFEVRAYSDHLDTCIVDENNRTNLQTGPIGRSSDTEAGHIGEAYFQDASRTFSWGSLGFAAGDSTSQVILYDIDILNLAHQFEPSRETDPLKKYYSKDYRCQ